MRTTALWTIALLAALSPVSIVGQSPAPFPMVEVEACTIALTSDVINSARWGGRIATYDASVDAKGTVTALKRRIIDKLEDLAQWVRLDQLEDCLKRWRFAESGNYVISLLGGNVLGSFFLIDVSWKGHAFRLRLPYRYSTPTG